jgi:vacuolar protein sorting-associated protein IST1
MHKYGREFSAAVMENPDGCVSERVRLQNLSHFYCPTWYPTIQVMKKLANNMPSADLVEAYLTEIARGYGVRWTSDLKQIGDDQRDAQDSAVVSDLAIL